MPFICPVLHPVLFKISTGTSRKLKSIYMCMSRQYNSDVCIHLNNSSEASLAWNSALALISKNTHRIFSYHTKINLWKSTVCMSVYIKISSFIKASIHLLKWYNMLSKFIFYDGRPRITRHLVVFSKGFTCH